MSARVGRSGLLVLGLASGLALGSAAPARGDEPPRAGPPATATQRAVEQLDADDPAVRRAAFDALRRRGPALLADLPAGRTARSAEQRRALVTLRAAVREDWARARTPAGMVYVPPGPVREPREGPRSGGAGPGPDVAWVPGFYLDRTEVTVGAWRTWRASLKMLGEEESLDPQDEPDATLAADLPVTNVRRESAQRFARDMRAGRLPAREEYLRAVRGSGLATWPWGARFLQNRAHLEGDGLADGPLPVGSRPRGASPFGAEDLIGNVAEWSASTITRGGMAREQPLIWGGSWRARPDPYLAWAGRDPWAQRSPYVDRSPEIGFRVARAIDPLPVRDAEDEPPPGAPR